MIFNNVINHLKLWCRNKAKAYETVYENSGGIVYVGFWIAYELAFKLSTLIDKPYGSIDELKEEILNFIDVHYEDCILNPPNNVAVHIIEKTNREFCEYLAEITSKYDDLSPADIPYFRIIVGDEAEELSNKFRTIWEYVNTSYWFPLIREDLDEIPNKFFIMLDYLKPYMKQLEQIIGLPQTHIYNYGEIDFRPEHCTETVELFEYGGLETIYTDKNFTWAIYFSHEDTVAFAGSIVPKVKELLAAEKEHWDKFEWHFD